MKRFLSLLLTVTLLLSVVCIAPMSVGATDGTEEDEGYKVYFIASNGWTDVEAYAYSTDEETGGISEEETVTGVELDRKAPDGSAIFGVNITIDFQNIKFSNLAGDTIECALNLNHYYLSYAYYEPVSDLWYEALSNTDLNSLIDNESTGKIITGDGNSEYYIKKDEEEFTAQFNSYIGTDTEFTVPDTFLDCPVTSIKNNAFDGLSLLESIHISANVTNIITPFISGCSSLTELTVASGNEVYTSKGTVDGVADTECNAVIHKETATLVAGTSRTDIPAEVTTIGEGAFSRHSGLTQITIPANVTTIENHAFEVTGLTELHIPATVTDIGDLCVIYGCHELKTITVAEDNPVYTSRGTVNGVENTECNVIIEKVTDPETNVTDYKLIGGCTDSEIPDEVTIISDEVFAALSDFDGFSIPAGIKSIGRNAFYDCSLITKLNVPASLTDIGENAFAGCELETIIVATDNPVYTSRGTFNGVENAECNAIFQTKTVTKTVTDSETGEETTQDVEADVLILGGRYSKIPDNVTVIGASAFQNRGSLYKITLPEQIEIIQENAFFNCTSLRKITILNENCVFENDPIDNGEYCATIYGKADSTAEAYATEYEMPFKLYNTDESSTIYFVASNGWGSLTGATAAMYYGDGEDSGEATAIEPVANDNYSIYSVKFDEEYESVTFKNGEETVTTYEFYGGWYYDSDTNTWYESLEALAEGGGSGSGEDSGSDVTAGYYLYRYYEGWYQCGPLAFNAETGIYENDYWLYTDEYYKVVELDENGNEEKWYSVTSADSADDAEDALKINDAGEYGQHMTVKFDPTGTLLGEGIYIKGHDCDVDGHSFTRGVCKYCGYECTHENGTNADGYCNDCGLFIDGDVTLAGHAIGISDKIVVYYYMQIPVSVAEDSTAKMVFNAPDTGSYTESEVYVDEAEYDGKYYIFECQVAAKEMTSEIMAEFVYEVDGVETTLTLDNYTVQTYAQVILNNPDRYEAEIPVVTAMLNYGAAAQVYFDYNSDALANSILDDEAKVLADVDLSDYAPTLTGEQEGVSYYGTSLSLKSETAIKHYFYFENEEDVEEMEIDTTDYGWAETKKNGSYYEIKIPEISARNIDRTYTLAVGDNITLEYGILSFGYLAMQGTNEELKDVVKAMYAYNQAADYYWENY